MHGNGKGWREYIHGEHCQCYSATQEMQYVTDSRRKLIWFPRTNATHFFDLEADPGECHNLIEDTSRGDEVKLWHGCLIAELEARDCGWVKDGELIPPDEGVPLVSPYRDRKWLGE